MIFRRSSGGISFSLCVSRDFGLPLQCSEESLSGAVVSEPVLAFPSLLVSYLRRMELNGSGAYAVRTEQWGNRLRAHTCVLKYWSGGKTKHSIVLPSAEFDGRTTVAPRRQAKIPPKGKQRTAVLFEKRSTPMYSVVTILHIHQRQENPFSNRPLLFSLPDMYNPLPSIPMSTSRGRSMTILSPFLAGGTLMGFIRFSA